ncbi:MAG: hypothetical protein KGY41_05970 [Desulfovermiculus sp.]|nr:hypothetical protein [Desulfovermiculus sp.]
MHSSNISLRQLAKVRKRPLHTHCRLLLQKAGEPVDQGTIGAPELMLWALHNKREELDPDSVHYLQEVVHMIKDKPSLVLTLLEPSTPQTEQEDIYEDVHKREDPQQAGLILLKHLKQRMDSLVDG